MLYLLTVLVLLDIALNVYLISLIRRRTRKVMADLSNIETSVANQTTVIESAETLLSTLSQELKDAIASNDPARLQAIVDHLDQNTAGLAAAVAANTPAAPPAPAPTV